MEKSKIMELYHDWDSAVIAALSQYVDKFHKPWPVYGPHDVELIDYCIKKNVSIDDLSPNDLVYKKYNPKNIIY